MKYDRFSLAYGFKCFFFVEFELSPKYSATYSYIWCYLREEVLPLDRVPICRGTRAIDPPDCCPLCIVVIFVLLWLVARCNCLCNDKTVVSYFKITLSIDRFMLFQ